MAISTKNYSQEQTNQLKNLYTELGNNGLPEISQIMSKPIKSIRAKLVKEQVYIVPEKPASKRKNGPSKKEIVIELGKLGVPPEGLDGATKLALNNVKAKIISLMERIENG